MYKRQAYRSTVRFLPYALITVSFVGWEVIKRTPIFISTTLSQQALRLHGVISGFMLLMFTCIVFARFCLAGKRVLYLYKFEKYLFVLLAVDVIALMIGFIRRNALVFLIGDTYKFSVIPLAYFCTTQTVESEDARKLFLFVLILETAVTLESFGVYAIRLARGAYERAPEHAISLLAFIFFLVALTSGDRLSRARRLLYWSVLMAIGLTALLSQARTLWVQILLCPFILLVMERKAAVVKWMFKLAALVFLLSAPFLLRVGAAHREVLSELGQRVTETVALVRASREMAPVLSSDRRVVEMKSAMDSYRGSPNLLNLAVGFGNGAEFYAPSAALGTGSRPGYKHHIHNGYVSLLFRMGVVGLVSFLLFAFYALRSMHAAVKHDDGKLPAEDLVLSKVIFVYFAATLIELLTIYSFIGDIKWGILLGVFRRVSPDRDN